MTLASFVESSTLDLEIVFGLLLFRSSAIGSVCEQDDFLVALPNPSGDGFKGVKRIALVGRAPLSAKV